MKTKLMLIVVLSAVFVAACGAPVAAPSLPTQPPSVIPTQAPSVLPTMPASPLAPGSSGINPAAGRDAAVTLARKDLAGRINVDPNAITVVSVEEVDWPDGCLGVQTPGVMCIMVITPGYRVIFEADGKQYEYHTNATGAAVRLAATK